MKQYHELLNHILTKGSVKSDRTGTGTISTFGYQMRFDLSEGFPLVTTKKIHWKSVVHELLWFISGSTNNNDLEKHGVKIWREWAKPNGELGPIYSKQWRAWDGKATAWAQLPFKNGKHAVHEKIDQLADVIQRIKTNPDDRGLIVSAWNVADLAQMALRPCHTMFQFYANAGKLSLQLYQRSGDVFLGVPFNIASYGLLLLMAAQVTGLKPGEFIHTLGDAHIYSNHIEQVKLQLSRDFKPLPTVKLNAEINCIDDFTFDDIQLLNYDPHPAIKGKVAV